MTSGHLGTAKRQTPAHNGASTIHIPPADVVRYTNEDVGSRGIYKQALKDMDCSHSFVFNNEMSRNGRTTPNSTVTVSAQMPSGMMVHERNLSPGGPSDRPDLIPSHLLATYFPLTKHLLEAIFSTLVRTTHTAPYAS